MAERLSAAPRSRGPRHRQCTDGSLAFSQGQVWIGAAAWPAILQFYDKPLADKDANPFLHYYQQAPNETKLNEFLINSDKTPDLGWVYTVIAGMLNILVIYDALAGPAFLPQPRPATKEAPAAQTVAATGGAL